MPLTDGELIKVIGAPTGGAQRMVSENGGMAKLDKIPVLEALLVNYANVERKTLTPSVLFSYLPAASPYTTPTLVATTPTKLLLPTTVKSIQDFELDIPNTRYFLNDANAVNRTFEVNMSTSMTTSLNNVVVTLEMWKNGVFEEGISVKRKVGTGADVGALALNGQFTLSHNDYIEVYAISDLGGTITFDRIAINIKEMN